jgi:hypothetical protein
MSRIIIKGLRKKLELKTPQQLVCEVVQPQKQPHSQVGGV